MVIAERPAEELALDVSEEEHPDRWELDPTRPDDHELCSEDEAWFN
jgi:hypothetical protein